MLLKRHAPSAIEKKKKFRIKSPEKNIENQSIFSSGSSPHETFILNLLKKPFKNPLPNFVSSKTTKSLGIRRLQAKVALHDPNQENALVLYRPKKGNVLEKKQEIIADVAVVVDPILSDILRPHQKEGVKFMYESITGIYDSDTLKITGCVMADEMGLGKTLQCVSLVWTLLTQSPTIYPPMIHNSVIVCPSSLVKNWNNEFSKWLGNRICCEMIADSGKALIDKKIKNFLSQVPPRNAVKVLIISYETLRGHREAFETHTLGIMICDEGHRLKNCENQTYMALHTLKTKYRILLSGTPIQNDLGELYSLLNFVNPGLLGSSNDFKKNYELPILKAREEICTEKIKQVGESKLEELIDISRRCVIRRTQALLTKFLPLKFENIICIKFSSLQQKIYSRVYEELSLESNKENLEAGNGQAKSLAAITQLKKICNHPCLVDDNTGQKQKLSQKIEDSGKLMVLDIMLAKIRNMTNDRVVLISNYTQTMDLFEELCKVRNYSFVRLDGTINSKKRQELVTRLNEPDSKVFVFMLSSKAGGCGLNLIGANRLFMFDPDWNPANDDQAMARVWRDGQKKTSFIYRFVCSGTIEELILQRQINKLALSDCVIDQLDTTHPAESRKDISQSRINADKEKTEANGPADNLANCSLEQLHALSDYNSKTKSYLHDELRCKRCISGIQSIAPPENSNCKDGIRDWHHCYSYKDLPDDVILKGTMMLPKIPINMIFYQKSHDVIK